MSARHKEIKIILDGDDAHRVVDMINHINNELPAIKKLCKIIRINLRGLKFRARFTVKESCKVIDSTCKSLERNTQSLTDLFKGAIVTISNNKKGGKNVKNTNKD